MIRFEGRNGAQKALLGAALCLGLASSSCQPGRPAPAADALDPALAAYVLADVPTDVPNRIFLDFGGKVALVGYAVEPAGIAAPGSHVKLTLYWQSESQLGPGWGLFTHLVIPHQPHRLLDGAGPLRKPVPDANGGQRQALGPSGWERGKVYVDPLEFDMPTTVGAPEVTIVAGVWRDALRVAENEPSDPKLAIPGLRLPVLSGPVDDTQRGVVMHISTGLPARLPPALTPARRAAGNGVVKVRGLNEANGVH